MNLYGYFSISKLSPMHVTLQACQNMHLTKRLMLKIARSQGGEISHLSLYNERFCLDSLLKQVWFFIIFHV